MPASSRPLSPIPEAVHPDQLLVATAIASGQRWNSARDFILSLAIQIPGSLYQFIQVYSLPALHNRQQFLLQCAAHSDPNAKLSIGIDYDVATALITKVENTNWTAAVVRYVGKGGELEEAMAKLKSADVPFDGSTITADQVKKEKARRQRLARKPKITTQSAQRSQTQPNLKRKRNRHESVDDEARRLAKTARNAGQKYIVTDDDKKQLVHHLAETPRGVDWEDSLVSFVENKEGAGRWSYPTWVSMLRKEKEFFDREVSILRRDTTKMAKGKGKGKRL